MSDPSSSDGLIAAYSFSRNGQHQGLPWDQLAGSQSDEAMRWIHLDFTQQRARQWLLNESGLDRVVVEAMLEDDSRPRILEQHDGMLLILRGVNLNPGARPEDMISIRCWIDSHRIITTRRRQLMSINSLRQRIDGGWAPTSPTDLLTHLCSELEERIGPAIDKIEDALDRAEEEQTASRTFKYHTEFSAWRRRTAHLRRFLAPQREALERASRFDSSLIDDMHRLRFREEADNMTRHLENLDLVRERAIVAQEEMLSRLAHEQNRRVYVLSLVAAIFLPLSFVTGLMGMNVAGMPGLEDGRAFWLIAAGLAGVAVGILLLFRFQKWL